MRVGVNGRFYGARTTGVQRVARELVARLVDRTDLTLYLPAGVHAPRELAGRAHVVEGVLPGAWWEQLELPIRGAREAVPLVLDPANAGPAWGGPRVLVLHDVFPLTNPEWYTLPFRIWFRTSVARAARRAVLVVVFSRWVKEEAVRELGIPPARIRVASQGVEPFDQPAPPERVRHVLRRLDITPPFLLATGAGDPRKNAGFLHEVLRRRRDLRPDTPPLTLVLAGAPYGHVQSSGEAEAPDLPLRRLGHVPDYDLHALYTAATAFCFPSLAEGFGRPPLEAMACGTPVLTSDYGSAREVLGDAAVRLPLAPEAWVAALADLQEGGTEQETRVRGGRAQASKYRWDRAAEEVLDACRQASPEEGYGHPLAQARAVP